MRGDWGQPTMSSREATEILELAIHDFTLRHVSRMMGYARHSPGIHNLLKNKSARVPICRLDLLLRALDTYASQDIMIEISPSLGGG